LGEKLHDVIEISCTKHDRLGVDIQATISHMIMLTVFVIDYFLISSTGMVYPVRERERGREREGERERGRIGGIVCCSNTN
jgi:hypothetical protein